MGWYGERGVKVIVTPLPGSTDCVKVVATGDLPFFNATGAVAALASYLGPRKDEKSEEKKASDEEG